MKQLLSLIFLIIMEVGTCRAQSLPDLGDSANRYLSPRQEQKLAQQLLKEIWQSDQLIRAPEIQEYLQSIGNRLVAASPSQAYDFHFLWINDPGINAFALPGGIIGVHTGLINLVNHESALAAVLAHELAHVNQRHIARQVELAHQMQIPTILATFAGILAASQNVEAGSGLITLGMAANRQAQLNFSRFNESDADRQSMHTLYQANFDPNSVAEVFELLSQQLSINIKGISEFLSSHPVNSQRLAEAQNLASKYPYRQSADSLNFYLVKAYFAANAAKNPRQALHKLQQQALPTISKQALAQKYQLALLNLRSHHAEQAYKIMRQLSTTDNLLLKLQFLRIAAKTEHFKSAQATADFVEHNYPTNYASIDALADFYLAQNKTKLIVKLAKNYQKAKPLDAKVNYLLMAAYQADNNLLGAYECQGDLYVKILATKAARHAYSTALKYAAKAADKARLSAKLKALTA